MEGIYEELDEAKAEIERLREELKRKTQLSENLKKSCDEQIGKAHEMSVKIEQQAREINEKAEEIAALSQNFEDIRVSLEEKESVVRRIRAVNEKLRADCDEKLKNWEEENKGFVLALEEANGRSFDQEQRIREYREEIEGLKGRLSASEKNKCLESEKKGNRSKEARDREDAILGLEEEKRKIEEKLKWKKEQFCHLEEAHRKLKDQFKASEKEWGLEKASLVDEICSVQARLDSQTRISEDLQSRLQMCNQALAREETRRKSLEVLVTDAQSRFEKSFGDCQDENSQLECVNEKRDEELASLRHLLGKKETVLKEMEYQKRQVERDNEEMRVLLKEFQESQIQRASSSSPSVTKLRNNLKCSEQIQKESTLNLRAKDSQLEKVAHEVNSLRSQLESKDQMMNVLTLELKQISDECAKIKAERKSQLEKVTNNLEKCKTELESRDTIIEELRMALENFQAREVELKSRVETTMSNLEKRYTARLASKDEIVASLKMELEQVCDKLGAEETETNSRLGKLTDDLKNYRSLLESRDATVKELRAELEQVRCEFETRFHDQEAEWKSRVETTMSDLEEKYTAQLASKDEIVVSLKMELEQVCEKLGAEETETNSRLGKLTDDLKNYRSLLGSRDATVKELGVELEQVRCEFAARFHDQEAERKSQVEMLEDNLSKCRSRLEQKDEAIKKIERQKEEYCAKEAEWISQLGKVTSDLGDYRFMLESKDAKIKLLELELEQVKGNLIENLKTKEAKWGCEMEMMSKDLSKCRSERDDKDARIKELGMDLANSQSLNLELMLQNEEISVMLLVLNNGVSDAQFEIASQKAEMDRGNAEREENVSLLKKSVEQSVRVESSLKKKLRKVREELERANVELAEKTCHGNGAEFELYIWKSIAESFKVGLEESFETRKELEASLLEQVIVGETAVQEKQCLIRTLQEKDERIGLLERKVAAFEEDSLRREIEEFVVAKIKAESDKEKVNKLMRAVESLASKLNSSLVSFSSQLAMKQEEINLAREKITATEIMAAVEVEEKKLMIAEVVEEKEQEMKRASEQLKTKLKNSDALMEELKNETGKLLERVDELQSEREKLLRFVEGGVGELWRSDESLSDMLENMMAHFLSSETRDSKPNKVAITRKSEGNSEMRSPFREINNLVV